MYLFSKAPLIDAGVNVIAGRVRVTVPGSVRNAVDSYRTSVKSLIFKNTLVCVF